MVGTTDRRRAVVAAVVAVVVGVAAWVAGTGRAAACSCAESPAPQAALAEADVVFVGTVVEFGAVVQGDPELGQPLRAVRLEVAEVFKGPVPELVEIHTPDGGGAACGYGFEVGRAELVYAGRWNGGPLTASLCSRTAPADQAAADLDALGEGVPPVPVEEPDPPDTGAGWLFPLAAVASLVVPLVTWAALRSGQPDRPPP